MIQVKNLTKKYKNGAQETTVLKNINFTINDKEFIAITGKSGSGKSTLLYQLSLLDTPTSGEIVYADGDVTKLHSRERTKYRLQNIGYVFQDYALIPSLTAIENVMVPLLMQGLFPNQAHEKAEIAMKRVGLEDRLDNLPSMLSGGQQQRVSIARAISHNPKVIYADEPTANLDTETSQVVLDTFLELNRSGQTIVMVTHEQEYAKLTHRVILLSDGQIIDDHYNRT